MIKTVSHDPREESIEAKARWFQSLSPGERMDLLCQFTDLIFENNPAAADRKDDQPTRGRVRFLRATRR